MRVSTSCADVLSIKKVGKDFHLLVTNADVKAYVSISAENPPYKLVIPGSGSCPVSLGSPAAYTVEKVQSPDHERDDEPRASGNIIMFRPDFNVRSNAPNSIAATGANELTDNFTATVNIVPNGIATLSGHAPEMTVVAVEKGTKINHDYNFSISVSVDEDSNFWPTSKTLWYGIEDRFMGCCHNNRFKYEFVLCVDGIQCARRSYSVGWPNTKPSFRHDVPSEWWLMGIGYIPEPCYGNEHGDFRAELLVMNYPKDHGRMIDLPDYSQYSVETGREESFHQQQWLGSVPLNKGGCQDLYTANGVFFMAKDDPSYIDGYVYANSLDEVEFKAAQLLEFCSQSEMAMSDFILNGSMRNDFREFHAKQHAGYNAAWKYHCTYGSGNENEPRNFVHPAYR